MTFDVMLEAGLGPESFAAEIAGKEPEVSMDLEMLLQVISLYECLAALRALIVTFLGMCSLMSTKI